MTKYESYMKLSVTQVYSFTDKWLISFLSVTTKPWTDINNHFVAINVSFPGSPGKLVFIMMLFPGQRNILAQSCIRISLRIKLPRFYLLCVINDYILIYTNPNIDG